ncbi:MAG TPA: hypothetical protein ENJ24_01575 [Gammaproteobacteria bacterium]|nr:hypothetical protein [Gammaproteobacteria bacterium]
MNRTLFPILAASMGVFLHLLLFQTGALNPDDGLSLPVLTLLFVSEFGFFVTAIGAVVGGRRLLRQGLRIVPALVVLSCAGFAAGFFIIGMRLWKLIA